MSGWLPPGVTDKDIDDAAPGNDMANAVQCDNCHKMFDPDEEGCFIGFHRVYGECCQCAQCIDNAKREDIDCCICGKSMRGCEPETYYGEPCHAYCKEDSIQNDQRPEYEPE